MTTALSSIPFVDLKLQQQPIQSQIEQAIQAVIDQGDFVLGQVLGEFETAFAQASGAQYGIGVACGTDAIALGLQAIGIGQGDEVILPANTFIATAIGVIHSGATPILVDCDPQTALIDLEAAQKAITAKTKAILPVHLYGQMVSPHGLLELANSHNLVIFEDAAQAHLAQREGYRAGSVGMAAAFSFYPSKNLGAFGDGGMVITRSEEVAQKMKSLRNYGAPKKYVHMELGTNSRLDTIQAAILNVKLPHLESWNHDRNFAAEQYDTLLLPLREKGIIPIENQCEDGHVYHLYVMRVTEECVVDRDTLQAKLSEMGVQTGIHYPIPCHLQPAYQHLGYSEGDFPMAEMLSRQILSLPMYPGLRNEQINHVVASIKSVLGIN
ncbi:MAG: DegT/DnrJ/EryC1/StrS family aminotransferase [Limnoraphis robusta]|uniref:DegT/DnrJ/EryC1/StrS family aminotransferase n=1 Tax=Limnoraphis robusta CCNP1315 TaxID=3110306 RepID=A0ABU5TWD4_9CYAN|nr:DegT/DnrJ/EryC1/StrS family aminotransferase [Limnoraphis robusta]MEA5497652.1 DegT/DnrJ/EryC1/StrS family aminotransferase [Limnoraphis robusta BA-68 BA1]MEA5519124.1 DegT/DnrJ/EryC1/StrS family aminotransferase [Limnoraphis robusta CCNP1315]MEA5538305.1 DegT/DnrJ/EryC1/StrS family aminotransferase [Limnoraphis robusta Tam1]MEA5548107.1 DegT/DnrJ/EryC1/StrS family aminotransferase [Limnoraphis robusta CCNP1324]